MNARMLHHPRGVMPHYLGQMFFDQNTQVFYQARELDPNGWELVTPDELPGSFVILWDRFLDVAKPGPGGFEHDDQAFEKNKRANLIRETMKLRGVEPIAGYYWSAASKVRIYSMRFRIEDSCDSVIFAGLSKDPTTYRLPACFGPEGPIVEEGATGFLFERKKIGHISSKALGDDGYTELRAGYHVVRIEVSDKSADLFIDGFHLNRMGHALADDAKPSFQVFTKAGHARPIVQSYEQTLPNSGSSVTLRIRP